MTHKKNVYALTLLCLISSPAWSRPVDFCKVVRIYDEKDLGAPATLKHEDCSGVAFFDYAKDYVKASCWPGAIDLLEGKCERDEAKDSADAKEAEGVDTALEPD